ncbi:hypothetical protein SODG_002955 [Sodalis praecaptivus]
MASRRGGLAAGGTIIAAGGNAGLCSQHHLGATILPQGFQLKWFADLWRDPRFLAALGHSLLICLGALLLSVLPVIFVIAYYFPWLDGVMNILILLPFAVPPVVSSVGLLQLYSDGPLALTGTPGSWSAAISR